QPGARCVDQHPVVTRFQPAVPAVGDVHGDRKPFGGGLDQLGAVTGSPSVAVSISLARCGAFSTASRVAPTVSASAPSSAALPPGPAHRSSHLVSDPSMGADARASAHNWLPSS